MNQSNEIYEYVRQNSAGKQLGTGLHLQRFQGVICIAWDQEGRARPAIVLYSVQRDEGNATRLTAAWNHPRYGLRVGTGEGEQKSRSAEEPLSGLYNVTYHLEPGGQGKSFALEIEHQREAFFHLRWRDKQTGAVLHAGIGQWVESRALLAVAWDDVQLDETEQQVRARLSLETFTGAHGGILPP